jgi:hypothetical protein
LAETQKAELTERKKNRVIEIHDSTLDRLSIEDGIAVLQFSHLYILESEGQPGVDPGTGWTQAGQLTIRSAVVDGAFSEWPADLHDGSILVGDTLYDNEIPIALDTDAAVRLSLESWSNAVSILGQDARLELIGEATYLEDFKPT